VECKASAYKPTGHKGRTLQVITGFIMFCTWVVIECTKCETLYNVKKYILLIITVYLLYMQCFCHLVLVKSLETLLF